jgi:bifunctional DNA-binding transcriptional regulator/antitoxin component of YhaV-PrlF toxin-antitoxin module
METTILSSTGQVTIPASIRQVQHWQSGVELIVENTPVGVLIKPKKPFPETRLEDGLGCVAYDGPPLAVQDIENLLEQDIREAWGME